MKETATAMKQQFKELNIDEVEDIYDDLEELMDDAGEIQELMGRSMGNMDDIDDDELEAELEGLDDELLEDLESDAAPSYLEEGALPALPAGENSGGGGGNGGGEKEGVDEYGLPVPAAE